MNGRVQFSFGTNDSFDCNCGAKDFGCGFAECETDDYKKTLFAFLMGPWSSTSMDEA